jgi:hypothetical protein
MELWGRILMFSRLANLLWAVQPEGTNYWAVEFVAGLMIPYGIDLWVFQEICND